MRKKYLPALRVENAGRDEIDLILEGVEGEIYRIYREAAVSLRDIAEEYLREFIRQDNMLRKAVQDGEMAQEDYNRWRISHMATGRRWFEASETMAMNMTNYNQIAASTFGSHLPEVYTIGFNSDLYGFEQSLGFMTSFTMFDISTVERLIRENPSLLPQPKVDIPKDMRWNGRIIASEMTQAIMQGETIDKIAARLSDKCAGMNQNAAIRNARTAFTSAENGGRNDNYRRLTNAGIKAKKTWIATLDARTRESHRWVDGQTCDSPEEEFSNGLLYPGDPDGEPEEVYNCRCTMITTYAGADPDVMKGSRSSTFRVDDGNGSFKDVTYQEWKGMKAAQSAQNAPQGRSSGQSVYDTINPDNPSYGYSGRNTARINPFDEYGYSVDMGALYEAANDMQYPEEQIPRLGLTSAGNDGIIYMRKGKTHRKAAEDGHQIIDKALYYKITKPAIAKGADIRIADGEWLEHMQKNHARAITIGETIYFRQDATVSDVLEEVYHFYQNLNGTNGQYGNAQRIIMNEIEAKQYLLTLTDTYHIPQNEVDETVTGLAEYIKIRDEMIERGEWDE